MANETIIVLGGALAGPTAAARARELNEHARIILVERNTHVSYAVGGLPYHLSGEVPSISELDRERAQFFAAVYNIEVWTEAEATRIDPHRRVVTIRKDGKEEDVAFDSLVFALGAASRLPQVLGLEPTIKNVRPFRNLQDLKALKAQLTTGKKRVTILGGGPIGVEVADALVRARAKVTLIEAEDQLLPQFGPQVGTAALDALRTKATVHTGAQVTEAIVDKNRVVALKLASGAKIDTDFVVVAAGLRPRTELLEAAGADLGHDGTVHVNEHGETSLPGIYACGVCVAVPSAVTGRPMWTAQGALADKTAQVAGANAAGGNARLSPSLGTMILRVLDLTIGRTGLSPTDAKAQFGGANVRVTTVHAPSHDAYFPGAHEVLVELVWDRRSGKLLGAEVAGHSGVDKRVDVLATALAAGMTVEALSLLDLGYSPPYGSQRDPINVAATVASATHVEHTRVIEPTKLVRAMPAYQLIDVRSEKEWKGGTLAGAKSIPLERLRERKNELDGERPVVLFCRTGRKGHLALRLLAAEAGLDVYNLSGGLQSWKLLGLPLERGGKA